MSAITQFVDLIASTAYSLKHIQTELIFFVLAIATHFLFFNSLTLARKSKKVVEPGSPKTKHKEPTRKPQQLLQKRNAGPNLAGLKEALRAEDIKAAIACFEELDSVWEQHGMQQKELFAWSSLMEQLAKLAIREGALRELLEVAAQMGVLGKAFDWFLNACADLGDFKALKEAENIGRALGVKFTATTYQALIKGASNCGQDGALVMADAAKAGMNDLATYCTYMKGLMQNGKLQEIRSVMHTMQALKLQPNIILFNELISAAMQTSTFETAWSIVQDMQAFRITPDNSTCLILLKDVSTKGKAPSLVKVLGLLDSASIDVDEVLMAAVVEVCGRLGRPDLLGPFLRKHSFKGGRSYDAHTYGGIIRAYGHDKDVKGAWNTWNEMRRQNVAPISVTLGCMVEALVTNGDIQGGYDLIQEVVADPKTAHLVNSVIYGSILKGFSHKKRFERVWEVYEEMVQRKLKFSMVTYNTLIDACARSGDLARIPLLLKGIDEHGLKMGLVTYSAILKGYCQKNRLEEAFELVEHMTKTSGIQPDEIMYNTLLDGCARQAFYNRGMALLEKMKQSGVRPSNFTLSVLVKMCSRGGKLDKAFSLCDEVSSEYGFRLNVHVFANLIQACLYRQDLMSAIGTLERCLGEGVRPDVRCYSMILRHCIETRQPEGCIEAAGILRAAAGLPDSHPRLRKYAVMAQPQPGLDGDLVSEIVLAILGYDERLASSLFVGLSSVRGLKLDRKLRLRFLKNDY